ncbi:MAG: tRNA nucleotidyltransferase/poly(A) polymerase, partial [Bradymonadia bacterium]
MKRHLACYDHATMMDRFQNYLPLFEAFESEGYSLYLVGGCVRDVVMGLEAVGDVDLATDSLPERTKEIL